MQLEILAGFILISLQIPFSKNRKMLIAQNYISRTNENNWAISSLSYDFREQPIYLDNK